MAGGVYARIVGGESYYTHGPLVPLVSLLIAYLLIRRTRMPVRPSRTAGAVVLGLSLLLHLAACLARAKFVSGFAFIGVLAGLVLFCRARPALRRLWFPRAAPRRARGRRPRRGGLIPREAKAAPSRTRPPQPVRRTARTQKTESKTSDPYCGT
jgi:hypothetical protein